MFDRLRARLRERRERRRLPEPTPDHPPARADAMTILGIVLMLWRNRRLLKMTASTVTTILGVVGLVCGAIYNAVVLKDGGTAIGLLSAALAAMGIGKNASVTRQIVDPNVPNPSK